MKVKYKGFEIDVYREKAMGGWDSIYYSVFRVDDGMEMTSGFSCDDETPVRDFIKGMKERVDEFIDNPDRSEDDF